MIKGFRDFILRGNVVDLAVAVVIGVAFGAVVTSLVNDVIMPIIAADLRPAGLLGGLTFTINGTPSTSTASFINAVVTFLLIAAGDLLRGRRADEQDHREARSRSGAAPSRRVKQCPECLSEIPIAAKKCAFCASPQTSGDIQAEA